MKNKRETDGIDCMMAMDRNARIWASAKDVTSYLNSNGVSWGEFDEIVEIINHYMSHVIEEDPTINEDDDDFEELVNEEKIIPIG